MDAFLATLFLIVCILLIIVVLLQKGRGVGLSGAFGGAGSSAFGTRTGDVFTWVTIVLVGVYLLLAIGTTLRFRPRQKEQVKTPTVIPKPGPIGKPIHVTIRSTTGKAKIFFTIDGSEPTQQSLPYKAPVRIKPGTTIMTKAFLRGWKTSELAVAHYPLATTTQPARPPTTSPGR